MAIIKTLSIEVEGKQHQVTGAEFSTMLAAVKDIQGRRWDGDRKLWIVPGTLDYVRAVLRESDLQIEDEDSLLDKEVAEIKRLQAWMKWYAEVARYLAHCEYEHASKYAFKSKSRNKAESLRNAGCLSHALKEASKAVEAITAPEIAAIRRGIQIVEESSVIQLNAWLQWFQFKMITPATQFDEHVVPMQFVGLYDVPFREFPIIGRQPLLDVYKVELAAKLNLSPAFLPNMEIQEQVDPAGKATKVMVFKLEAGGDA